MVGRQWLAGRSGVHPRRVALLGWSMLGTLDALTDFAADAGIRFAAGIAFYPDCRRPHQAEFVAPVLVLAGGRDVWIQSGQCARLQRRANAPDYFGPPRVVVALDTEPAAGTGLPGMKDRLFLGYQPRSGIVEAISWNPLQGRFEFQVIRNYREGETPSLVYAQRSICTSCHQNSGPLFALAPWSETNANPRVFNRLAARHKQFEGRSLPDIDPTVEHIDAATNRGAMLQSWQRLWRDGCGGADALAFACRGALLTAMVQFRLAGGAGFAVDGQFRTTALDQQKQVWRRLWPKGTQPRHS